MYTTLIEPEELAAPLSHNGAADSDWTVLDCRFDLPRPDWGASAYAAGHVPNALYAHLDRDLSGPITPGSGRHPLPSLERVAETFGRWGIDDEVQVVAYDQGNGAFAARLWWLLRWAGHRKVAVLNGGFAAWQQAGLPTDTVPGERQPRIFTPRLDDRAVVSTAELERMVSAGQLASGASVLVDARGADRFAGENETIDPVAGHIPGARNHPFVRNVDAKGRFLPAGELRERWLATLGGGAVGGATLSGGALDETTLGGGMSGAGRSGGQDAKRMIGMCGSGVTACHNLLALEVAGLPGARLYAGSWSEWIRDPGRPVTRGAES
jgi:thiosulfate/3-mercaptopyruvate sulfurtransferase